MRPDFQTPELDTWAAIFKGDKITACEREKRNPVLARRYGQKFTPKFVPTLSTFIHSPLFLLCDGCRL